MARKKVGVQVDQDVWEEFNQFVQDKHGFTRGVLGSELDKALKNHVNQGKTRVTTTDNQPVTDQASMIDEGSSTHTHQPTDKYEDLILSFKKKFKTSLEIPKKHLETFIMNTLGISDPRAITNKIRVLENRNLIKPIAESELYENLLASELSKDTIKLQEEYYSIVKTYFRDNNIDKIDKDYLKEKLPRNIRDPLVGLDPDKFIEFVE